MNNFHSSLELKYKKRLLAPLIRSAIESFPIVVVSGARQVGKSTLLENEFPNFKYINLDDFSMLKQAKEAPASLWINEERVIIDEAQRMPEIFPAIKLEVDKTKGKRRFIISGSSNLLLMEKITESLAGRAIYFELMPMTYGEINENWEGMNRFLTLWERDLKVKDQELQIVKPLPFLLKGFMPSLLRLSELRDILLWWEGYIKTFIERDLRELSQIESLIDFRRLLDSLALRTANVLNQTEIARDVGISQPTAHRYIKLLEVSNIIKRVQPFAKSRSKRITKSPKVFFLDPALSVYLSGYHDESSLKVARELGGFFETMVFLHLTVLCEMMVPKAKVFYFRTTSGKEVDFVLEYGKKLIAVEAKYTKSPKFEHIKNLLYFIEEHPDTIRGILIHAGNAIKWLHSKIIAIPWWWVG
ncbi:MAG: ATP-binding protein [Thermodesulfovibrio sp.]|nr:ATP-binding protein [Thermodesulfovibrio sp.]